MRAVAVPIAEVCLRLSRLVREGAVPASPCAFPAPALATSPIARLTPWSPLYAISVDRRAFSRRSRASFAPRPPSLTPRPRCPPPHPDGRLGRHTAPPPP